MDFPCNLMVNSLNAMAHPFPLWLGFKTKTNNAWNGTVKRLLFESAGNMKSTQDGENYHMPQKKQQKLSPTKIIIAWGSLVQTA